MNFIENERKNLKGGGIKNGKFVAICKNCGKSTNVIGCISGVQYPEIYNSLMTW